MFVSLCVCVFSCFDAIKMEKLVLRDQYNVLDVLVKITLCLYWCWLASRFSRCRPVRRSILRSARALATRIVLICHALMENHIHIEENDRTTTITTTTKDIGYCIWEKKRWKNYAFLHYCWMFSVRTKCQTVHQNTGFLRRRTNHASFLSQLFIIFDILVYITHAHIHTHMRESVQQTGQNRESFPAMHTQYTWKKWRKKKIKWNCIYYSCMRVPVCPHILHIFIRLSFILPRRPFHRIQSQSLHT